jgi:L-ascorbate metabolism protein UlaG (beta-lactamase superfamily)
MHLRKVMGLKKMKITKYVHSCILVETSKSVVLFDPGGYSRDSHLLNVKKINSLDYIVITHEHPDHYNPEFLQTISGKFPHIPIITNNDLVEVIRELKLPNSVQSGSDDDLTVFEAAHEPLPMNAPNVLNIGVHIDDKFTNPGDSYDLQSTREVLALPITGPFASYKDALDAIVRLKPKIVLPIHDWEWHKSARLVRYDRAKKLLTPLGIEFIELENGETVEI